MINKMALLQLLPDYKPVKFDLIRLCLFITIAIGFFLRSYNINWDKGYAVHPDERNIAVAVTNINLFTQFDPRFYSYGSLPIYIYRALVQSFSYITKTEYFTHNLGWINLAGRLLSALFSTISIYLIYKLARLIFNRKVALMAAWVSAFTPIFIQYAHFAVIDNLIVLLYLIIQIVSIRFSVDKILRYTTLSAFLFGIASAVKLPALLFITIFLTPITEDLVKNRFRREIISKYIYVMVYFFIFSAATYIIFSPISLINLEQFIRTVSWEVEVAIGKTPVYYTRQFSDSMPYLGFISQLPYTLGITWILIVLTAIATPLFIHRHRKINRQIILVSIFPVLYFMFVGLFQSKFVRYLLPIYPYLIIMTVAGVNALMEIQPRFKKGILVISVILPILSGGAFFNIYINEHTRIQAAKYLTKKAGSGDKILVEDMSDLNLLLADLNFKSGKNLEFYNLPIFELEKPDKFKVAPLLLTTADYLVIGSNRQIKVVYNNPADYPNLTAYYKKLFNGDLGFGLLTKFQISPTINILGYNLVFDDTSAEETFTVFDHPQIMILKNFRKYDIKKLENILYEK